MRSGTVIGAAAGFVGGIVAAFVLSILGIKGHEGQIARAITLVSHARSLAPRRRSGQPG